MDDGTVATTAAGASIDLLCEHSDEMAFWLALGVLQLDPVAADDPELLERLRACQERLEERLRACSPRALTRNGHGPGTQAGTAGSPTSSRSKLKTASGNPGGACRPPLTWPRCTT